jgi:hypothetical protein
MGEKSSIMISGDQNNSSQKEKELIHIENSNVGEVPNAANAYGGVISPKSQIW